MKTLKKKIILALTTFAACAMFSGCCLSHEWEDATCTTPQTCAKCDKTQGEVEDHTWEDATCTAPKTCSECGKTKGDALEHTWTEATCSAPKTCSVCKTTEGEALEHTWTEATCMAAATCSVCNVTEGELAPHILSEANFQTAATCSVCGGAEGEALQADFDKYGYVCYDAASYLNQELPYSAMCYENPDEHTLGYITLTSYEKVASYGEYTTPEGYEWLVAHFDVLFFDEMAQSYGISVRTCTEDYYTIKMHDDTLVAYEDYSKTYTVNFNGHDYTECRGLTTAGWSGWTEYSTNTYMLDAAFCVPVGYDGTVLGFRDAAIEWGEGQYLYDLDHSGTVFYRFQ